MKRTILIVDDNKRNIDIIARLLKADYELVTAESGEEALEVAGLAHPDIVLLDIMMPGIDGYEVCRRLRARSEFSDTKIIMVSAKAMTSERLEGYDAGADDYVTKPFDLDELEAKIKVYARLSTEEHTKTVVAGLLKNLSNRIGTPLSYMQDASNLLNNEVSIQGRSKKLLEIVCRSADTIRSADNEIKLLSTLELGDAPPCFVPTDPAALLQRALIKINWLTVRSGCLIETESTGNGIMVVDEHMTVHAISAMLELAMRRSSRGGRIRAKLNVGDECTLEVSVDAPRPGASAQKCADSNIVCRIIHLVAEAHEGAVEMKASEHGPVVMTLTVPARVEAMRSSHEPLGV